jgi:hypothetical protein
MDLKSKKRLAFMKATEQLSKQKGVKYKEIYIKSGIDQNRFYSVKTRHQEPGDEMISAIDRAFPGFADTYNTLIESDNFIDSAVPDYARASIRQEMEQEASEKFANLVAQNEALRMVIEAQKGQIELLNAALAAEKEKNGE